MLLESVEFLEKHNGAITAIATAFIALFTIVLALVTHRQAKLTRIAASAALKSANIAENALTTLERPYVFVLFNATFEFDHKKFPNQGVFLRYSVANYGKTAAIIENVQAIISVTEGAHPETPLMVDQAHDLLVNRVMPPNDVRKGLIESVPINAVPFDFSDDDHPKPEFGANQTLYFRIVVTYRGSLANRYETSACWRYQPTHNRFVPLYNAKEYNYMT